MFKTTKQSNMELEIIEQKKIIPYILLKYINPQTGDIKIDLPQNIRKIVLVASGSSYHCARFAVDLLEKFSQIESRAIYSSEFLLKSVIPHDENTLYIFITQSGETSDTIKSVEKVKRNTDLKTLCITNNEHSTIWSLCDYKVACFAGVEHGIAATKSFTSQMLCLILISLKLVENVHGRDATKDYKESLVHLPIILEKALAKRQEIKKLANSLSKENIIIAADGISYSLAKEAALKIKETSYKNISAAILGEFMHGHVAVLNNKSTLIYIAVDKISERSMSNLNKIKSDYNPKLLIIGPVENKSLKYDCNIYIECENEIQQMCANILVCQQLALEIALKLKRNVDNPKGLHKIVKDEIVK